MIYITGDTHGQFERISRFCERMRPSITDVMIILGDAGFNYYGGGRDQYNKEYMDTVQQKIDAVYKLAGVCWEK